MSDVLIPMSRMAELLGWDIKRVSAFLHRHSVTVDYGNRRYTTMTMLRSRMPELADALAERIASEAVRG